MIQYNNHITRLMANVEQCISWFYERQLFCGIYILYENAKYERDSSDREFVVFSVARNCLFLFTSALAMPNSGSTLLLQREREREMKWIFISL